MFGSDILPFFRTTDKIASGADPSCLWPWPPKPPARPAQHKYGQAPTSGASVLWFGCDALPFPKPNGEISSSEGPPSLRILSFDVLHHKTSSRLMALKLRASQHEYSGVNADKLPP